MRLGVLLVMLLLLLYPAHGQERVINVAEVDGIISPATSDFIIQSIRRSEKEGVEALIIKLDTPGGLEESMRTIIKEMLNAEVPVVVYVAPSGARAASAGAIITLAAHIAAMAPGTSIGAAHPVAMGGQLSKTMEEKIVNYAASYAESIAKKRGRNVQFAIDAVRKSTSVSSDQALKLKVIDLISPDLDTLIKELDGRKVSLPLREVKLSTRGAKINNIPIGLRQKILAVIGNPNVAYILMLLGMAGLYFELANPGAILPGVVGGISLLLAFFAFQTLPINYAGILLIILALLMFIAELKTASHGILTAGGLISLALGSLMLFESPLPFFRPSWSVLLGTLVTVGSFVVFALTLALRAQVARPKTGLEGLVGEVGEARTKIAPAGKVFVHGEYWDAVSSEPIEEGERIKVVGMQDGMKLKVTKLEEQRRKP